LRRTPWRFVFRFFQGNAGSHKSPQDDGAVKIRRVSQMTERAGHNHTTNENQLRLKFCSFSNRTQGAISAVLHPMQTPRSDVPNQKDNLDQKDILSLLFPEKSFVE
jgi:hypothetical protein